MCGICGFISKDIADNLPVVRNMAMAMQHRGPDDLGVSADKLTNGQVLLGHARLSILDLSSLGHQPMKYGSLVIVFNGEIYNFLEIRESLKALGHRFESNTDTEVILHAYSEWGRDCVQRFVGMFAFAILDREKNELALCRDRAGVKPLYYFTRDGQFLFASDLSALHAHPDFCCDIDLSSLGLYFRYRYILGPQTIFKDCFKLPAGHWLVLNLSNNIFTINQYWDVSSHYQCLADITFDEAQVELEAILKSAFAYRMVSDVPVGVFLSGGYDSSTVAALLQHDRTEKIKTFTIGFKDADFNEAEYANEIARHLGTEHTELYCQPSDALKIIPELPEIYSEPFADSSSIPTILVSRMARQQVKVALSADGGDETFAGYRRHFTAAKYLKRLSLFPASFRRAVFSRVAEMLPNKIQNDNLQRKLDFVRKFGGAEGEQLAVLLLKNMCATASDVELSQLFQQEYAPPQTNFDCSQPLGRDPLTALLSVHYKTYLVDDIMTKVDRATMSVSLEGREPLLDHRIIEFVATLPIEFKYDGRVSKKIFREITHKYVPAHLLDRPKSGFAIPLSKWLRKELSPLVKESVSPEILVRQGLFDKEYVMDKVHRFNQGDNYHAAFVWRMLMFQMWHKHWVS
ncbi:MAG: asparagine synthase (glutamine-hydrolyzing) [Desulfuromonadales bacterium]|nr:asparagine synthase (glutamine-hydrolyzing) [Desulfuromonadales bacterium]